MPRLDDVQPMLLDDRKYPAFDDANWLFEIKYDGYRMLAEFGDGDVQLRTRQGQDCTLWFPEIVEALAQYSGGPYITDGEVCVLDEAGRSDFDRLQERARRRKFYEGADPVTYCMFDLLVQKGRSVMSRPLLMRKEKLKQLFTPKPAHNLLVVGHVLEKGTGFYKLAVELKLEGLTAKHIKSKYVPGIRTNDWRKLKRPGAIPAERFQVKRPKYNFWARGLPASTVAAPPTPESDPDARGAVGRAERAVEVARRELEKANEVLAQARRLHDANKAGLIFAPPHRKADKDK